MSVAWICHCDRFKTQLLLGIRGLFLMSSIFSTTGWIFLYICMETSVRQVSELADMILMASTPFAVS